VAGAYSEAHQSTKTHHDVQTSGRGKSKAEQGFYERKIIHTGQGRQIIMGKSHRFDELSDRECSAPGCSKKIKQRMVDTKDAHLCYKHWCNKEADRRHLVNYQPRRKRVEAGLPVKTFA
jgi:hypothetical protein